jgi:hypothetical protein
MLASTSLDEILAAAVRACATYGYDGVSLRTINRELSSTAALISLWVKPFQYSLEDISHGGDLVVVEQVDKVSANGVGMRGGSVSNRPAPFVGEFDHGSAGIFGAGASADESPLLHSGNQV